MLNIILTVFSLNKKKTNILAKEISVQLDYDYRNMAYLTHWSHVFTKKTHLNKSLKPEPYQQLQLYSKKKSMFVWFVCLK